ncbi:hypothetical protein LTR08_004541 [Meristemomyces frigidus]|nr:hypothetical protein LTR08_004541 [Meristemomyces frigidus]
MTPNYNKLVEEMQILRAAQENGGTVAYTNSEILRDELFEVRLKLDTEVNGLDAAVRQCQTINVEIANSIIALRNRFDHQEQVEKNLRGVRPE